MIPTRPVAMQSHIRKLIEKPIATKIQQVWNITPGQHGYRNGTSAEIAIQIAHEQLQLHKRRRLIGLDLSGAFDRTSIPILKKQINRLNLSDDWKRIVTVFAENSARLVIGKQEFWTKNGIPQGGTLSPTLWDLFTNTLQQRLNTADTREPDLSQPSLLYADDTSLIINLDEIHKAQQQLDICSNWATESNAEWNVNKCWILLEPGEDDPRLTLSGRVLPVTTTAKLLGTWFNAHGIDFEKHTCQRIQLAQQKTQSLIGLGLASYKRKTLKTELPIAAALTTYKAFIRPILEYGCKLTTPDKAHLEKLDNAQTNAILKLAAINTTRPKAMRAALRLQSMQERLAELQLVSKAKIQTPKSSAGNEVLDTLQKLNSPLTKPLSSEQLRTANSKALRMEDRQLTWQLDTANYKIKPPFNDGLPPVLKINEVKLSMWILKWFCGSPTNNLTGNEQNSAFPDLRNTIVPIIQSKHQWTPRETIFNISTIRRAYAAVHKAVAIKKQQERNNLLSSNPVSSTPISNSVSSIPIDSSVTWSVN